MCLSTSDTKFKNNFKTFFFVTLWISICACFERNFFTSLNKCLVEEKKSYSQYKNWADICANIEIFQFNFDFGITDWQTKYMAAII